jgi:proteasome activator subunit 3 (PA28 gamma)
MIPKIEDGNNFGVSIQEDTLGEIQSVESEAAAFFDQISRYFVSRGKIVSKVDIRIHECHVVRNRAF